MVSVGIRDLKNHLSEYIRRVVAGEIIVVTDRGRVVAELRPPLKSPPTPGFVAAPSFWEKVARGEIRPAQHPNGPEFYVLPPLPGLPEGTALRLIDEDRDESLR